jgi:hypothetical protein
LRARARARPRAQLPDSQPQGLRCVHPVAASAKTSPANRRQKIVMAFGRVAVIISKNKKRGKGVDVGLRTRDRVRREAGDRVGAGDAAR